MTMATKCIILFLLFFFLYFTFLLFVSAIYTFIYVCSSLSRWYFKLILWWWWRRRRQQRYIYICRKREQKLNWWNETRREKKQAVRYSVGLIHVNDVRKTVDAKRNNSGGFSIKTKTTTRPSNGNSNSNRTQFKPTRNQMTKTVTFINYAFCNLRHAIMIIKLALLNRTTHMTKKN